MSTETLTKSYGCGMATAKPIDPEQCGSKTTDDNISMRLLSDILHNNLTLYNKTILSYISHII